MQELPHLYRVGAASTPEGFVALSSPGLARLESASPAEFGGPGTQWSPETLLVAAIADCFVLTFKSVAKASKFDWRFVSCEVEGTLDRRDGRMQFVRYLVRATLEVPAGTDEKRAYRLLEKAEENCLITNSLNGEIELETEVRQV
ncbi:MAG TPA: OsmC family protein [Woeseiaceae bacterium]|nr:OsmC family protein [Woeseiaceae bacterium]